MSRRSTCRLRIASGSSDALDDLIENNRRRIELLEQMAQAIYREWFVHFRYPGHEDVRSRRLASRPDPRGLGVSPLASIAIVRGRVHPQRGTDEDCERWSMPSSTRLHRDRST